VFAPKVTTPPPKATKGPDQTSASRQNDADRLPPLFGRSATPRHVGNVPNDPGQPLDTNTRAAFETSFRHDFSSVRVHADERAATSAASLSARAYTIGRDVVFGRGEYAPETAAGRHLIGHELAHVVQQSRGGPAVPGADDAALEAAADYAANEASRGAPVRVGGRSAVRTACKTIWDEFTDGKYVWELLKGALEHGRPVATIVSDINGLSAADREKAITDITRERAERGRTQAYRTGQQSVQADPKLQTVFDPVLAQGKSVLDRIDAVIEGLTPGAGRTSIPGWNFTPEDFAKLQGARKGLTMAPDSGWFPARLQENLSKTLAFVLGSMTSPTATEGVNAMDFFHGHLVVKKDPATDKQVEALLAEHKNFRADLKRARTKAIGDVSFGKGYHMTEKSIAAYKSVIEKAAPALGTVMSKALSLPGAALMYHTFEFNQPLDVKAKGQKLDSQDPRRHYVTPLDTNTPTPYTPPAPDTYEKEYTHITSFVFLVDKNGAVHVRPFDPGTAFTTLELSTITGTTFPEPL
jgi:hypothetical protein